MPDGVAIRAEADGDHGAIRAVNEAAFGRPDEAALIEQLRDEGAVLISMIAELRSAIVGHILFSRAWIDAANGSIEVVALAPMAVMPGFQRTGIGGGLIRRGLDHLRISGESAVIVLGHRDYYPRFGFSTAKAAAIESPFPRDAFMAMELVAGALEGIHGKIRYAKAFGL